MNTMIVHHHVRNYEAWRPAYDKHEPMRTSAGLTHGRVFRAADDPNDLVLLFDVADKNGLGRLRSRTTSRPSCKTLGSRAGPRCTSSGERPPLLGAAGLPPAIFCG